MPITEMAGKLVPSLNAGSSRDFFRCQGVLYVPEEHDGRSTPATMLLETIAIASVLCFTDILQNDNTALPSGMDNETEAVESGYNSLS
jgi:hypothetical protein